MDQRIVQFVAALRAAGVRISLAESADAFYAIDALGIQEREIFKTLLRTTLVKDASDNPTFDQLFDLYFLPTQPPPLMDGEQDLSPEEVSMLAEALRQFTEQLRNLMEKVIKGEQLSQDELRQLEQMTNLSNTSDLRYQDWMARQMEQAMQFREVRQAMKDLMEMLKQMGMNQYKLEQLNGIMQANQEAMREQLRQYAGQRIAENMAQETRKDRMDNLYNQPFRGMGDEEMQALRKEVRRLAAAMRTRLALRLKRARTGQLDSKATLRANLKHGSVPIEIRHRDHTLKPKIVVLCDVSTSMQHVSELMLNMLYAIQDQISKTHAFAFIDHLEYISPYFEGRQPSDAVNQVFQQMPGGHYNTDLGSSLETFLNDFMDKLDNRSTLIIVGDARNNYNDPRLETFRRLARRSRNTIWLNPEAMPMWGTGDSDMLKYAPLCSRTFQVGNLAQLAASIDHLLFMH